MNYLEMKKKAISSIANKIKGFLRNSSGTPPISLESCADTTAIDYKIYGNSYQATRSGKNLLDMNKLINERQESSLGSGAKYYPIQLKANTSYTLSTNCYTDTLASFFINLPELAATTADNGVYAEATYRTVTTDDTGILWIWTRIIDDGIAILDTTDFDNGTYWVQLEKGTTPTAYEQYGASPSPDYPSEVQSVGEKTKNLFDEELLLNNSNATKTDDGYKIAGYPVIYNSSSSLLKHIKSVLKPGVTYTLSRSVSGYVSDSIGSIWIRNSSTNIAQIALGNGIKSAKFAFTQDQIDSIVNIYIYGQNTSNPNVIFHYIQLEEGNAATEYEPYGYKIPVTARSKNLFDSKNAYLLNGDAATVQTETGFISHKGYTPKDVYDITSVLKPNTTYYVHRDLFKYDSDGNEWIMNGDGNSLVGQIKIVFNDGSRYYQYSFGGYVYYVDSSGKMSIFSKTGLCTFVTPSSFSKVTINTYLSPGNNPNIQDYDSSKTYYVEWKNVYLGTEPYTDYVPYHEPTTTNIYLDEPLRKVGDYADYIDFKNSMVVRNVAKLELKRGSFITYNSLPQKDGYSIYVWFSFNLSAVNQCFCTHLRYTNNNYGYEASNHITFTTNNNRIWIGIDSTIVEPSNNAKFKEWLTNNNPIIYYVPKTPTQTSISLPILPTFKGITTIYEVGTTIQPSNIEAEYYSTLKGE